MNKLILALFAIPMLALSQGATNDYIFYQKPASGPLVVRPVTPTVGRLMGWPTSISAPASITLGTGLSLSGSTLNATASSAWGDLTGVPAAITSWGAITRASGFDTFTATPTLANLSSLVSDANIARTDAAQTLAGIQTLSDTTASTSSTTGALIVGGGIGANKDSWINGIRVGRGVGDIATNTVVGASSLLANTTGLRNTAVGNSVLSSNTTGGYNNAFGFGALYGNTTGVENSAFGCYALQFNDLGSGNAGFGHFALWGSSGDRNVGIGRYAGAYAASNDEFYVNNQDRTDTAGDQTLSLLYGTFAATATAQQLTVNAGSLTVDGGTTGGKLALRETNTNGENVTGFIAPSSLAADVIYTLPSADGTNGQALVTNGSGTLSFATVAASGATLAANTFTGLQQFSGTTHAGIRLNNLTTAERDAIAAPAAGMAIWNTTDGRLQLHNGSAWTSGMVRLSGDTMTGALINSTNGAASTSALSLTGTIFTGGTGTTNVPQLLIIPSSGVTSNTGWSTAGTGMGIVLPDASTGNFIEFRRSNTALGRLTYQGRFQGFEMANTGASGFQIYKTQATASAETTTSRSGLFGDVATGIRLASDYQLAFSSNASGVADAFTVDLILGRAAAASLQLGTNTATASATATGQTLKGPNATGTTSTGGSLTIAGGTGTSAGGAVIITTAATTTQATAVTVSKDGVTTFAKPPVVPVYTVATLPATAAAGMVQGAHAIVTDATTPTYLGALTGGGAVVCPVFYNGTAWVSH